MWCSAMELKMRQVCLFLLLFSLMLKAETRQAERKAASRKGGREDGQLNKYPDYLEKLIPGLRLGRKTKLVLEIGNGGLSGPLEDRGVLTLSIADNGAQQIVQRAHPTLVQHFSSHRLPYSSQAFDLLHCSTCDLTWLKNGSLFLLEADRILRAGGFFLYAKQQPETRAGWAEAVKLARSICWKLVAEEDELAVWQKPSDTGCYNITSSQATAFCDSATIPLDAAWNVPLQPCLMGLHEQTQAPEEDWRLRILNPPVRLKDAPAAGIQSAKPEVYEADTNYWRMIASFYLRGLGPSRIKDIHNVIDMNAGYGGFAAAVALQKPSISWWVLSAIPVDGPDRLPVILDRGLLGIYHDWCEALPVRPHSFDMLHASRLFSSPHRCTWRDILLEMHRLLRPGGFAIIREQKPAILIIRGIADSLHWKTHIDDTESGPMGKDKILHCQRTSWQPREKGT